MWATEQNAGATSEAARDDLAGREQQAAPLVVRQHPLVARARADKHRSHAAPDRASNETRRAETVFTQTVSVASPRSTALPTAQRRRYRQELKELHRLHRTHLSRLRSEIGLGSDADDELIALSQSSSQQRLLEEIEEALRRLDDGKFGLCQDCGRKISAGRLEIIPYARRCPECQRTAVA